MCFLFVHDDGLCERKIVSVHTLSGLIITIHSLL